MQLVVDVGNTETVLGVVEGSSEVVAHWRISTQVPRTRDETVHLLRSLLEASGVDGSALERAVLGSVVPHVGDVLADALGVLVGGPVLDVGPDSGLPVVLDVEEPRTVGADRIVNTLAARELYGRDTIVVDLGTATTYDLITADGVFMGGVIAPGVSAGLDWLGRRTAKLPRVILRPPSSVIGRRTETCIQSGIFYGVIDGVEGMLGRLRAEWGRDPVRVVATGGFAETVGAHCTTVDHIEPFLTLRGLAMAGDLLAG